MQKSSVSNFHWACKHTWNRSAKNTAWCLLGCSIGDFGTILFFQLTKIPFPVLGIMTLAIINGLITSIILETIMQRELAFNFHTSPQRIQLLYRSKQRIKHCRAMRILAMAGFFCCSACFWR